MLIRYTKNQDMKTILLCVLPLLFLSCSELDNTARIESLKVIESFARSESFRGQEKLLDMELMSLDVTEPDKIQSKVIMLENHMNQADSLSVKLIDHIDKLRKKALGKSVSGSEEKNVPDELDYSPNQTLSRNAFLSEEEAKNLINDIEEYRNLLCEKITTSQLFSELMKEPYYFKTPQISKFNTEEEKHRLIKNELKKSNINQEDLNCIFEIMNILTKKRTTWMALLSNEQDWIDYSMSLLTIQQQILEARWRALKNMSVRISYCATFEFTDVEPVVNAPSLGFSGDTIQFEVFLAAYHRLKEQEASLENNGEFLKFENGKAHFEVVLPESSGELELNGELTNLTKSGRRIPRSWAHTIQVIESK
jgi:hypothetical protein